jgi:hypothetical protein
VLFMVFRWGLLVGEEGGGWSTDALSLGVLAGVAR